MWWSILKSSRGEAYAEFVKEYGPEVELDSLEVLNAEGTNQVQIFPDEDSNWFITYDVLSSGEEQFVFESSKYGGYEDFVEGMFENEYSERYKELLGIARGSISKANDKDMLLIVSRYLRSMGQIMGYLTRHIADIDGNAYYAELMSTLASRTLLEDITPLFISETVGEHTRTAIVRGNFTKGILIRPIVEALVDRLISDNVIAQRYNKSIRAINFRNKFIKFYYNLFMTGIDGDIGSMSARTPIALSSYKMKEEIHALTKLLSRIVRHYEASKE